MQISEVSPQTRITMPIVMALLGASLGGGVTWGAMTAAVGRVDRIEAFQRDQSERLTDHQGRLLLLERAVLSLERMAQERDR